MQCDEYHYKGQSYYNIWMYKSNMQYPLNLPNVTYQIYSIKKEANKSLRY